ncbi:MAG TPA: sulfite exporter TauE/SafE family protein [Terriglobales bacterium]|nr:sulfite exporter TauE/SafE family protein [Terriglobales bacterium]
MTAASVPIYALSSGLLFAVFAASFAGVVIQCVTGFGYAIVLMAVLPLFVPDLTLAVAATGVITFAQSLASVWRYREGVQWKLLPPCLAAYFVMSFLAIRLAAVSSVDALRRPMGAFLIALAAYFVFFAGKVRIRGGPAQGGAAGAVSGVTGGLFAIGGPPMVVYFLSATGSNAAYMATLQAFFLVTGVYTNAVRLANGLLTRQVFMLALPALAGLVLGMAVGVRLFDRLDPDRLRKLVYAFMAASGLWILISG